MCTFKRRHFGQKHNKPQLITSILDVKLINSHTAYREIPVTVFFNKIKYSFNVTYQAIHINNVLLQQGHGLTDVF